MKNADGMENVKEVDLDNITTEDWNKLSGETKKSLTKSIYRDMINR